MSIQAIETRYAGCRFRSRLEARWAVFFDYLGAEWDYEPEGYVIDDLAGAVWAGPYLPDFRTSSVLRGWVEVKGAPTLTDIRKAAAAAIPWGGLPGRLPVWLLGSFGRPEQYPTMAVLQFHKGDVLWAHPWEKFEAGRFLANDSGDFDESSAVDLVSDWRPGPRFSPGQQLRWRRAIKAARSARFEHGERP